jgi:hypothetical protein
MGLEGDLQDLDKVEPRVLGALIGGTLERGNEELHPGIPRSAGSPFKDPRFAALQA